LCNFTIQAAMQNEFCSLPLWSGWTTDLRQYSAVVILRFCCSGRLCKKAADSIQLFTGEYRLLAPRSVDRRPARKGLFPRPRPYPHSICLFWGDLNEEIMISQEGLETHSFNSRALGDYRLSSVARSLSHPAGVSLKPDRSSM